MKYLKSVGVLLLFSLQLAAQKNAEYNTNLNGFIENKGQIVDQNQSPNTGVKYLLNSSGFNVQLRQTGFSYDTYEDRVIQDQKKDEITRNIKFTEPKKIMRTYQRVDVEMLNANTNAEIISEGQSNGYLNYLLTYLQKGGIGNVHAYRKVIYKNIYPSIDLEFSSTNDDQKVPFEYQFVVHQGGDPGNIKLVYKGANKISLHNDVIQIGVNRGNFTEKIPRSYFIKNNKDVEVHYEEIESGVFGFSVPKDLMIDGDFIIDPTPCLQWGTYYGINTGNIGGDVSYSIVTDPNNNVFIGGTTNSPSNIATAGAFQSTYAGSPLTSNAFIAKFNPSLTGPAQLLWGTYFGGSQGEVGIAITIDVSGNVYLTGNTSDAGLATLGAWWTTFTAGGGPDAFVAKIGSNGSNLIWCTYYGDPGEATGTSIALDATNNVYICGWTAFNPQNMSTPGAYQASYGTGFARSAFAAKFNSNGTNLLWGTFYGGNVDALASSIAVSSANNVYITGETEDNSGFSSPGAYQVSFGGFTDAFIAEFNPSLSGPAQRVWGTYYGGTGGDWGFGIALDASDNVYVAVDGSSNGMATPGAYQTTLSGTDNAVAAKFNPTGSTLLWASYYGGVQTLPTGIVLDAANNIYMTGYTNSTVSIATPGAYQTTLAGNDDAFVCLFNPSLPGPSQLVWGTYYGGTDEDDPYSIALDQSNDVYITGATRSFNGISTPNAYLTTHATSAGLFENFAAEFGCNAVCAISINLTTTEGCLAATGNSTSTATANPSGGTAPYTYSWTPSGQTSQTATGLLPGIYTVTVTDAKGCSSTASITVTAYNPPTISMPNTVTLCNGSGVINWGTTVNNNGSYSWSPAGGVSPSIGFFSNPGSYPVSTVFTAPGTYTVTVSELGGCSTTASITVYPALAVTISPTPACISSPTIVTANPTGGLSPYTYLWSNGSSTSSAASITVPVPGISTTYTITVTDANECTATASFTVGSAPLVTINPNPVNVCTGPATASLGITTYKPGGSYFWSPGVSPATNVLPGGPGSYLYTETFASSGTYTVTVSNGIGCSTTASVQVNIDNLSASNVTQTFCTDATAQCITLNSSVAGGTGPYTYSWSPITYLSGNTNATSVTACIPANAQITQVYNVTATDANGCTVTSTVTLNTYRTPTIGGSAYACSPANVYTVTNAVPPFSNYTWSSSNSSSGVGTSATPGFTSAGGTITFSNNGCTATYTVNPCCEATDAVIIVNQSSMIPTVYTNQTIYINGTYTVNSPVTFSGCDVNMGPMAKIDIIPGGTLNIHPSTGTNPCYTHIHAGCNEMWSSISINTPAPNVTLTIFGTLIEDGDSAVVSVNGGGYNIQGTMFNKNYKGMVLEQYGGANSYTFINNILTCKAFTAAQLACPGSYMNHWYTDPNAIITLAPHAGQRSYLGMDIKNVNLVTINAINFWDDLDNGIIAANSSLTINQQVFTHINPGNVNEGAIFSTGSPLVPPISFSAGSSSTSNYFRDCTNGIVLATNFKSISIQNNVFHFYLPPSNSAPSTTGISVSSSGVFATTATTIYGNLIDSAYTSIFCNLNRRINATIQNNTINSGDACLAALRGIVVNEVGNPGTAMYTINNGNVIDNFHEGINVNGTFGTIVDGNTLHPTLVTAACPVPLGDGVVFTNCKNGQITNNTFATHPTSSEQYSGITVNASPNTTVCTNNLKALQFDTYFTGNCKPSGVINNTFKAGGNPNAVGIYIDATALPACTFGSAGSPSGNTWNGAYVEDIEDFSVPAWTLYYNGAAPTCAPCMNLTPTTGSTAACNDYSRPIIPGGDSASDQNLKEETGLNILTAKVYPNPASTLLNVEVSLKKDVVDNICIYNSIGQLIRCESLKSEHTFINTSNLPGGLYYYRITNTNGDLIKADKVVIIH